MILVGIALVLIGGYILARGLTYTAQKHEVGFAGIHASVEEKKSVPPWVGVVLAAGGVVLVATSVRRRP
jgi:hypothetical protein